MSNDVAQDIGIAADREIEPPAPVDPSLPDIAGFIVFLSAKRRVSKIFYEQSGLFGKSSLDLCGR